MGKTERLVIDTETQTQRKGKRKRETEIARESTEQHGSTQSCSYLKNYSDIFERK